MTWTLRDAKKERAITDKIEEGDDRSAGILAGAFIQDRLIKAVKARMIYDKSAHERVYGPLSDFRSQIDIAYLLSIILPEVRDKLHIIREIRNRFAHRLEAHDFDAQLISDLCTKLFRIPAIKILKEMLDRDLEGEMKDVVNVWLGPLIWLPDTARNAYMNTIKIILFFMEADTLFAVADRSTGERTVVSLDLAVTREPPSPEKSDQ